MVNVLFNKILDKIEKKSSIFIYKAKGHFGQPNTHIHTHTNTNTQLATYILIFKLQIFKDRKVHSHV